MVQRTKPGSPSYLRPGTPAIAKFLLDLGYNTGELGKNHLGDHTAALPTARENFRRFSTVSRVDAEALVDAPLVARSSPLRRRPMSDNSVSYCGSCRLAPATIIGQADQCRLVCGRPLDIAHSSPR